MKAGVAALQDGSSNTLALHCDANMLPLRSHCAVIAAADLPHFLAISPGADSLRSTTPAPVTWSGSWLLVDSKAQPRELSVEILRVGAMPAATHKAMADPCAMGLSQQLAGCTLLERHGSREDNSDSPVAEGHKIHGRRSLWILIQLQPAILWNSHRPIVHLTAGTS